VHAIRYYLPHPASRDDLARGPPDATVDLVLLVDPGGNAPKISRPRRTVDPQRAANLLTCQRLLGYEMHTAGPPILGYSVSELRAP
jgi:hypothetical protein